MQTARIKFSFILLLVTGISSNTFAWSRLTNEIAITCNQNEFFQLDCRYRPLFPGAVNTISAEFGSLELPVETNHSVDEDITAIFFLIDTSDPDREKVVQKNIKQLERLLIASKATHKFGLATFDKKLRILAPIGSSKSQIMNSTRSIHAEGKTTELYRNLLLTIEKLSRTSAKRKAIYLFSDGQAEDKAYFHADVVKAARNKSVVINSIGFPRSVSLSVALQTLRRLSEETGGSFTEANSNFELDDKFYRDPFQNIDAGDDFRVDLAEVSRINRQPSPYVKVLLSTEIGVINFKVPVSLPVIVPAQTTQAVLAPAPVPATQAVRQIRVVPVSAPSPASDKMNYWLWYGLPVTIVVLFLISIVTLILVYRKQPDKNTFAVTSAQQNKPFAYLVTQEENSTRYPITNTTWRIGRSRDNELSLDDNSVSRLHAEIHRNSKGVFNILDMKSLNGVYVNEEQITTERKLEEGDIIEIGDIYLRFTQLAEDYQLDDDTAVQKTRIPTH